MNKLFLFCALLFTPLAARADLGFWGANLVGTWRHPVSGDRYHFRSDATYTFTAGAAKRRTGQMSHVGFWKIVEPTPRESGGSLEGPVALLLKSRRRVVWENSKRRMLRSNRVFRLVVDVMVREENRVDKRYYHIGGVKWVRMG